MRTRCCFFMLLLLNLLAFPLVTFASSTNPIAWKLDRAFLNPVLVGRTYNITYTLTNQLPFKFVKPFLITNTASPASEFTYDDQCTGKYLAPQQSCLVTITLTPVISGQKYYQLTFGGYDRNQVKLPEIVTLATGEVQSGVVGVPTQWLPYQLNLGSAGSYAFSFTNYAQTTATNLNLVVTATGMTLSTPTTNCGTTITQLTPATPTCTVSGSYTPISPTPSSQSVVATLSFDGVSGSPAVTSTSTIIQTGQTGDIVGSLVPPNELPPLMVQNTAYTVQFLFTNTTGSQINLQTETVTCLDSNSVACNSLYVASGQTGANSCITNPIIAAHAACQMEGTFTSPAATNPVKSYTLTAALTYPAGGAHTASVSTAGTVVTTLPTQRTITLTNQCNFPVWFSFNGAAVAGYSASNCPPGTSAGTKDCFWTNPPPNSGGYELTAGGGTTTATIPAYSYAGGVQWSGNVSASTLCSGSSCVQADCHNAGGTTSCTASKGFSQPATQAEFTMNAASADSYDVEVINGFHLPISIQPYYYTGIPATPSNYTCGTAGSLAAGNGFGACDWTNNAAVPSPTGGNLLSSGYYWVTLGGKGCDISSATNQCGTGELCGLSIDRTGNIITPACGEFLGYWSADQICSYPGISSTISSFFSCNQSLPSTPTGVYFPVNSTLYDLMACSVPPHDTSPLFNSCYNSYPSYTQDQIDTCCGCVDWWLSGETHGQMIGSNSSTQSCGTQIDPYWTQYVQPMVQWMKYACPSAYTFPFDDKTSTFTCTNNLANQSNSLDYTITFCPGGNTGLPNGIAPQYDGRIPT